MVGTPFRLTRAEGVIFSASFSSQKKKTYKGDGTEVPHLIVTCQDLWPLPHSLVHSFSVLF